MTTTSLSTVERRRAGRVLVLDTAERMFAEQGVFASTSRQIGEAAGQGNPAVAGYHFGTKADLVRAITRRFTVDVERSRAAMLTRLDDSAGIREWLGCLIHPWTDHFATQGTTYFARLCAQAMTDAKLKAVITEEACLSPSLRRTREALTRCLPAMPADVAAARDEVVQQVIVQMCAERERAVAAGERTERSSWRALAGGLIDALAGIWTAPCTTAPPVKLHLVGHGRPV
ncbi:TetR/AcrR family transcriptional regulator [Amycolatopsis acidicola]|uniref:TetR/AcrR family transcriptional regulator n=1 Tax=Amycolatopsis acidicola TaxID=2596893 RepID=A0A5N0V3Q3_9PSEU|nr:TetR/AcrR family transcriptional regulator [Amycolatopsis acidicola]KAA9159586.1 TetR/AcrR family transcriptional regulator [Amycolatopsis acidicola]